MLFKTDQSGDVLDAIDAALALRVVTLSQRADRLMLTNVPSGGLIIIAAAHYWNEVMRSPA